ncbi:hypothetical protein AAFC00_007065 [Neodothiora populina]|uniref:protein disulfide-isomerase n=1 Tax=Neodothiora populina TaxID=2781224 RepID=A0ABR3PCN2_9PEZI
MVNTLAFAAAAASLLLVPTVDAAGGIYPKGSPVLQVDSKTYGSLIENSNHTSIVEFYAPWCGHCQNLKPAYEKAAKSLLGLANVAAINCDEDHNKPLCGRFGVQGFPTLKIIKPGKKPGRPIVEDYQGQRSAKAIVEAVKDKIPNHVKRISDKNLEDWLAEGNATAKAVLFTNKGITSPLLKALAVDFLGSVSFAQIRDKEANAISMFGITSYPTLLLLPGGAADAVTYDGEMKKEALSGFLSQIAPPNPDPAPKAAKSSKPKKSAGKQKSANSAFSKASTAHESADSASARATQTSETLENEGGLPTESPNPNVVTDETEKPVQLPKEEAPLIPTLTALEDLQQACLTKKSGTCILAIENAAADEQDANTAILSLSSIHHRHTTSGHKLFPFYTIAAPAAEDSSLLTSLNLPTEAAKQALTLVAINAKRHWIKKFTGSDLEALTLETWIDSIRMGDGAKQSLPDSILVEAASPAATPSPSASSPTGDSGPEIQMEEISDEDYERLMKNAFKVGGMTEKNDKGESLPTVDLEFEDIDDDLKEGLIKQAKEAAEEAKKDQEAEGHDEL